MNQHKEFRQTYLGAAPHSIAVGSIWIISGLLSHFLSTDMVILIFFFATAVNFPIGEFIRKLMKAPNRMSKENNLAKLFPLLSFTIPLSIPLIFMACQYNLNWFFPAFAILVGAHYLPFVWAYQMPTFAVLGLLIVFSGSAIGYFYSTSFDLAAYSTGGLIILFGIIHLLMLRKEIAIESN